MPVTSINPTTGMVEDTLEPHDSAEIERRLGQAVAASRLATTASGHRPT